MRGGGEFDYAHQSWAEVLSNEQRDALVYLIDEIDGFMRKLRQSRN